MLYIALSMPLVIAAFIFAGILVYNTETLEYIAMAKPYTDNMTYDEEGDPTRRLAYGGGMHLFRLGDDGGYVPLSKIQYAVKLRRCDKQGKCPRVSTGLAVYCAES